MGNPILDSGNSNPANTINNLTRPNFTLGKESENAAEETWQPPSFPLFPIRYLGIPGLNQGEKEILSQIYFVVINDNSIKSFTQLYKENRLGNASNYVTADSVIHPLFAFQNHIRLKVIEHSLLPLLESILISMIRNNEIDYKSTEDAEIKEEIKYNIAFLTVGIKLLVPDFPLPNNVGVRQLVDEELTSIRKAKLTNSAVFHRAIDYSIYNPTGFYQSSPAARHFYSCYQWLSRNYLELSDVTSESTTGNGNEFRRAFLLFQSLNKVKSDPNNPSQKPQTGLQIWKQINKILADLGINSANRSNVQDMFMLPDNIARALASNNSTTISVSSLSNSLNRTRLLLTIRAYAPRQFNSKSIFALNKDENEKDKQLTFHLLNPLYDPSQELLLPTPIYQKEATGTFSLMPVALLLLQTNGVRWANKILEKNASKLDEQIINELKQRQNVLFGNGNPDNYDSFWKLFTGFSNPYSEKAPLFAQTAEWRTFCLERQAAAWVDSSLAIKPVEAITKETKPAEGANTPSSSPAGAGTTISSTIKKYGIPSWRTSNTFNYLEPDAALYTRLAESQQNLEKTLTQSGLLPPDCLNQSRDFIRLLKRLAEIAKVETNMDLPKPEDQSLLATIDKLLEVIETPLSGKIFIHFPATESNTNSLKANHNSGTSLTGVNMELGYPATVYIIMQYKRFYYLLRGATYSYYEQCGEEINEKHWQRQLEFGFIETPFWCQPFHRTNASSN